MNLKEQFERSKSISIKTSTNGDSLLTIDRKSRFIMKDAKALLKKIEESNFDLTKNSLTLILSCPICSKSSRFLETKGIVISR